MSGVVYGLLGYIWMKASSTGSGYDIHPNTVLHAYLVRVLPGDSLLPIANTVHGVGLGVGVAWGFGVPVDLTTP